MSCPSLDDLLQALRAQPESAAAARLLRHTQECPACASARAWIAGVLEATAVGPLPEVPAQIERAAVRAVARRKEASAERRRTTFLERVRDALAAPIPAGVRGAASGTRQLYAGEDAELDLEIVAGTTPDTVRLTGQLFLRDLPPPRGVLAALVSEEVLVARAEGDAAGIFVLSDLSGGVYTLSVWAPDQRRGIEIRRLTLEASAT